ncbi:MAG: hypothetical protein R3236_09450, partial [Phycisphaeraceae bacterium]|nr:hypothetical protein [Phycisphaeraceae bacterium]
MEMMMNPIQRIVFGGLVSLIATGTAFGHDPVIGHPGHDHSHEQDAAHAADGPSHVLLLAKDHAKDKAKAAGEKTTGQGPMVFSWDRELTGAFPEAAKPHEPKMHGGFNEDPETGIVYTGIPGYGLCSISADLKTWKKLGDDKRLKDNIHGIVFFKHNGEKRIAVAQNGAQKVLIVDLSGKVLQELGKPTGDEFKDQKINNYYKGKRANFKVTDVTYHDGRLYAVTGYSNGDFVLTAHEKEGKWAWGPIAWGGRGKKPGQFRTAHGVYAHEGHIYVANREAHQVVKFTAEGKFVETLPDIPKGSRVCNVAFENGYFFFCPLKKIGKQASAPIYAHTGEKLVSTIIPGELGIPVLNNIHHAWPHEVTNADGSKQLYLLVHG